MGRVVLSAVWGVAALLLVINGVLWALNRAADSVPTGPTGALFYVTTFDAYNDQWAQFPGQLRATIEDGSGLLVLSMDDARAGTFSELSRPFGDFDASVDAGFFTPSEFGQVGLLFRFQDRNNYLIFKVRGDGAYRVERVVGGEVEVLSEWQIAPQLTPGGDVRLRVVGKGEVFTFALNGQPVLLCPKGTDRRSTWAGLRSGQCVSNGGQTAESLRVAGVALTGKIGLGGVSEEAGLQVAFDNLVVLAP